MTAIDLGDVLAHPWPALVDGPTPRPLPTPWPSGPCLLPVATDPALDGWQPPTLDDLGLTADPVAIVLQLRAQIDELIAGMSPEQRADLPQYEPTRHLKAVA